MFNEAENGKNTLSKVEESLSNFKGEYEIIAVNDGSNDNTKEILDRVASFSFFEKPMIIFGFS